MSVLKIPAMCDFAEYKQIQSSTTSPYIMYCGSIAYNEVIEFILEIYSSLIADKIYNGDLVLVISGSHDNNWKKIRAKIDTAGIINNVLIKSNIPYSELLSLYKGADVLLIPLRKSIQDTARFPHKIGEYTASGRPIVSTNIGELKIYFKDGVSAILADDYTVSSYVGKLTKILPDKSTLDNIGKAGYTIGVENFDFHNQGVQLQKFILNL
jgi:glycosyltransferase involved in cell wall biosynthesis